MQAGSARRFWMDLPAAAGAADVYPIEPLRVRQLPMLAAAASFALGDAFACQWHGPMLLVSSTVALLALFLWSLRRAPGVAALPLFGFWVAVGCWCATLQAPVPQQKALRSHADGLSRTVEGRVERVRHLRPLAPGRTAAGSIATAPAPQQVPFWRLEPGAWESDGPEREGSLSLDLAVRSVEEVTPDRSLMQPAEGGVRITLLGPPPTLHCGDVVALPLRLRLPEIYRDPGAWSYNDQLLREGIGVLASAPVRRLNVIGSATSSWRCRLFSVQTWASGKLAALPAAEANSPFPAWLRLDADDAAMLAAMLFGDRSRLLSSLRTGFERTGTFHLFVVSGLHVALLAAALFAGLRRLRLPEGAAVALTLLVGGAYALLTGWGAPVQRALLMTAAYLIARALGRETTGLNALGTALLAILALDPRALTEPGFQMTALVIVGVAGLAVPVIERTLGPTSLAIRQLEVVALDASFSPGLAQRRVHLRLWCELGADLLGRPFWHLPAWLLRATIAFAETIIFGLAIEVCMVLPMAVYFHRATLLAVPVNLLAIPLVAALLSAAVLTFAGALVGLKLAALPAAGTALLLHLVRALVLHVGRLPAAELRVPAPMPVILLAAGAALAFSLWALRSRSRSWLLSGLAAAAVVPALALLPEPPRLHPGVLEVTAIDVGQGDSLLVVSPEGRTMLVDAGGPNGLLPSPDRWDVGEQVVAPYLWSRRLHHVDVLMLSHAHSDHMGGMPAVLADFHPCELWIGAEPGQAPALQSLLAAARAQGVLVRRFHAGDRAAFGSVAVNVLAPESDYANPGEAVNDDSLVVRLGFGAAGVLLEGDAEAPSEAAMLSHGRLAPVTLLKVGHHGSRTSTNPEFLAAVAPQAAVVSVGSYNTFGHPRREVLSRLELAHVHTWRTDREGARTFLLSPDGRMIEAGAGPD